MKNKVFAGLCSVAILAASTAPAVAAVNCGIIKKDLERGRTAQDISERMGVSVAEVNKCKDAPAGPNSTTTAAPSGKPGTSPKEATNPNPTGR